MIKVQFDIDGENIKTIDMKSVPRVGEYIGIMSEEIKVYKVLEVLWLAYGIQVNNVSIELEEIK